MIKAPLPAKTERDVSLTEFCGLVRIGRNGLGGAADAFADLEASWTETGRPSLDGEAYGGGRRVSYRTPIFCIDAGDVPRLARRLGLRIGGFPAKGGMLIRQEAASRLKATSQNAAFRAAWDVLDAAARAGAETHEVGGARVRISMVTSGTRSASAIHPDDVEELARGLGMTAHLRELWSEGWLNEPEAARRAGTHYANRTFKAAWHAMARAQEASPEERGPWEGVRCAYLKKAGVVTLFLHETAVPGFLAAAGVGSMAPPPPKTEEWVWISDAAESLGMHPLSQTFKALTDRLAAEVEAGAAPTLEGAPIRFERRSSHAARPWCLHRDELSRVEAHLGYVKPIPRGEGDMSRYEVFTAGGSSTAGTMASKAVWDACVAQWAWEPTATVHGHEMRGGMRQTFTVRHWCLERDSLPAFLDAVRVEDAALMADGLTRDEVAVALRVSQGKDPAFRALWAEIEALAMDGGEGLLRGEPFRAGRGRTGPVGPQVTYVDPSRLETIASLLGREVRQLLDDEAGYVRTRRLASALGVPDDGYLRLLVTAMREAHDDGRPVEFDGEAVDCGYVKWSHTPFAVAEASLPTVSRWLASIRGSTEILVRDDGGYVEEAEIDAMLGM